MSDEKELIRRALMGDKQAQEECTAKGIALPCPCCGRVEQAIINGGVVYHVHADCLMDARLVPLHKWNTRPAPPIGRCGECKNFKKHKDFTHPEYMFDGECKRFKSFNSEYAFCSSFEPREE